MAKRANSGYLPSLDGWRALSVIGVMLTHDEMSRHNFISAFQSIGYLGVYVFFAISGFLLPSRMLEEERVTGSFHLKGFYIRRIFRIQPAMLAYLSVIAALTVLGFLHDHWKYFSGALFSYRNFQFIGGGNVSNLDEQWFTGHFWSLSIEEHFYVLLSLLFLCARNARIYILGVGLTLLILVQQLILHQNPFLQIEPRRSYWVLQLLFLPSLLALLVQYPKVKMWVERVMRPWIAFSATLACLIASTILFHRGGPHNPQAILGLGAPVLMYSFGFWIVATVFHPHSWTTRLLELKPFRFIGRMSYSIYLWQQLFFWHDAHIQYITNRPFLWLSGTPQHYLVVFALAAASYYLLEKPMVRLGHRLSPPASPGHRDLAITPGQR